MLGLFLLLLPLVGRLGGAIGMGVLRLSLFRRRLLHVLVLALLLLLVFELAGMAGVLQCRAVHAISGWREHAAGKADHLKTIYKD